MQINVKNLIKNKLFFKKIKRKMVTGRVLMCKILRGKLL